MTSTLPQSASGTKDLVAIDVLGPGGEYRTRNREVITDTARCGGGRAEHRAPVVRVPHHRRAA
jgi:hypothetical protein